MQVIYNPILKTYRLEHGTEKMTLTAEEAQKMQKMLEWEILGHDEQFAQWLDEQEAKYEKKRKQEAK